MRNQDKRSGKELGREIAEKYESWAVEFTSHNFVRFHVETRADYLTEDELPDEILNWDIEQRRKRATLTEVSISR